MLTTILERLRKSRPSGQGKYRAPCPVHEGKDFNLMLSEDPTGKVGCHCFVCGANGIAVVEALGLPVAELFPPNDGYVQPVITGRMREEKLQDQIFCDIYDRESESRTMTLEEKRRYRKAKARIEGLNLRQNKSA